MATDRLILWFFIVIISFSNILLGVLSIISMYQNNITMFRGSLAMLAGLNSVVLVMIGIYAMSQHYDGY